jgi:hypothetical protein
MNFALMALLVGGLSFAVTSCKDDDNENGGGSTSEEQIAENAEIFWSVVANLVSPFDATDEYENKTFEPTIGEPMDGNSTIRVVSTGDMASAAQRFADLTGAPVDENTTSYTYQDDAVGTLVYTKTNDGTSLATVDVSIKQIPHLQKIVYKTPEQMGTNGTFKGTPYYSFGDVILRYNQDDQPEYWVCIRPAIGDAGKEKTHWMTVSRLPQDNTKLLYDDLTVIAQVPTKLGASDEHMQNLAEMLYAMFNPDDWWDNLQSNPKVKLFHDLYHVRAKYFNQYYWKLLLKDWEKNGLFEMIFGYNAEQMKNIVNNPDGLNILSKGYTGKVGLYQWNFKNGTGNKSNMHDMKSSVVKKEGTGVSRMNLFYDQYYENHWVNEAFFGDANPRFVFRTAEGKELLGSTPNKFTTIASTTKKISDVFVFNREHKVNVGSQNDPIVYSEGDVNPMQEYEGDPHYKLGDVYKDEKGKLWFVVSMAGGIEKAGISELVSFQDCFTWQTGGGSAYTYTTSDVMPSRDGAIRALVILEAMRNNIMSHSDRQWKTSSSPACVALANVDTYAKVNLRRILQNLIEVDGARANTEACTIVYGPGTADGGHPALRFLVESHNKDKIPMLRFYEHYPSKANTTSEYYTSFSNVKIMLSDLNNQSKIDAYAKDFWATRQLSDLTRNPDDDEPRTVVNRPDDRANDPRNFIYEYDTWDKFNYTTGMWNDPILVIAFDAVVDRGETYRTSTVNGHTLTLVHATPIVEDPDPEKSETSMEGLKVFEVQIHGQDANAISVDGKTIELPKWSAVWRDKLQ